ncbi:hypothetical protein [Parasphingorhabdus pacifica]
MTGKDQLHGPAAEPPRMLRVSVGLWCALAAFLLAQAGFAWTGRADLQNRLLDSGAAPSASEAADQARSLLLTNTWIALGFAAVYLTLGLLLLRRLAYVRVVLTVLAALHLVLVLGSAALSLVNVIVFALLGAALATVWRRTSTHWLTGER